MINWNYEDSRRKESDRREKWFQNVKINPAPTVLIRLCREDEDGLRGVIHGGDLYWWQSWLGTHSDALHWMKMGSQADNQSNCMELNRCDDGEFGLFAPNDDALSRVLEHPTLKGCFDDDGSLRVSNLRP